MKTKHLILAAILTVLAGHSFAKAELPTHCKPSLGKISKEKGESIILAHKMGHHIIQTMISKDRLQSNATAMVYEVLADYYSASLRNDPDLQIRKMDQKTSFDLVKNDFYSAGHPLRYILWSLRKKLGASGDLDQAIHKTTRFWGNSDLRYKNDAKKETWKKMTMDYLDHLRLNLQDSERGVLDKVMEEVDLY